MNKKIIFAVFYLLIFNNSNSQLIDSFSDGDFTSTPIWSSDTASAWTIITSSDVSAGVSNSNTLRLNYTINADGVQSISTQIASMASVNGQSWSFWIGRRAQAYTTTNKIDVWLYANESNLESTTVDGYLISIGDNSGGDDIRLNKITNNIATTIITSTDTITNGLTDIGFMIRVTRTSSDVWTLYTSTIPTVNATGAIATDEPNSINVATSQGSGTDNTYSISDNGYFGIVVTQTQTAAARVCVELDQIYFDLTSSATLPVELTFFTAHLRNGNVILNWTTATESANYGFEIERTLRQTQDDDWVKIGFVKGNGTSASPKNYTYTDASVRKGRYAYRLKQIDRDGTFEYHKEAVVVIGLEPNKIILDGNYPNPFNNETMIGYQIPIKSHVTLRVFDILGKEVKLLVNEIKEEGFYTVKFSASELPHQKSGGIASGVSAKGGYASGVYYYRIAIHSDKLHSNNAEGIPLGQTEIKKMLMLK